MKTSSEKHWIVEDAILTHELDIEKHLHVMKQLRVWGYIVKFYENALFTNYIKIGMNETDNKKINYAKEYVCAGFYSANVMFNPLLKFFNTILFAQLKYMILIKFREKDETCN